MKAGKEVLIGVGVLLVLTLAVGCETTPTQQGALMGGMLGAGTGAIIGNQFHHSAGTGALIGGLGGAAAGALIGEQTGNRGGVAQPPAAPVVVQQQPVVVQQPPVVVQQAPVVIQPYPVVEGGVTVLVDPEDYYYMYGGAYHRHYYDPRVQRYFDVEVRTIPRGYHYVHGRIDFHNVPERYFRHRDVYRRYHH